MVTTRYWPYAGTIAANGVAMLYHNSVDAVFSKVMEVLLPSLRTKRKKKRCILCG